MTDVMVGFNASPASMDAARWAAGWASKHGRGVALVAVLDLSGPWSIAHEALRDQFRADADQVISELAAAFPGVPFRTEIRQGKPVPGLRAAAAESDLLVVGNTGRGALEALLTGNVAREVAASSPGVTVVVVPKGVTAFSPDGPVVLGIDETAESAVSARFAFDAAGTLGVPLRAVHVREVLVASSGEGLSDPTADAARALEVVTALEGDHPGVAVSYEPITTYVGRLSWSGRVAESLAEQATDACLVVVGTRGSGALSALVFGSIGRDLAAKSPCAVAIVG